MRPVVTVPPPRHKSSHAFRRVAVVPGQADVDVDGLIADLNESPAPDLYRVDARQLILLHPARSTLELLGTDTVALVCHADRPPRPQALELVDYVRLRQPATRVVLVLLQSTAGAYAGTSAWLDAINPDEHHHVRVGAAAHYQRLTRALARRGVALVLGSGGARGFAHLGVWAALAEAGVPVDAVGGCSMGAFVAAQIAYGLSPAEAIERTRHIFLDDGGVYDWRFSWVSLIAADRLTGRVSEVFGAHTDIEDLALPWFCVTTSLTNADKMLHRRGRLVPALRASSAIPGVAPPVAIEGQYHLDGAVLDSLPTEHARTPSIGAVIAVNVTPYRPRFVPPAPGTESRLRLLAQRVGSGERTVATLYDTLMASIAIRSAHPGRRAHALADLTIEPPVSDVAGLDPRPFDSIVSEGRRAAAAALSSMPRAAPRAMPPAPPKLTDPNLAATLGAPRAGGYGLAEHDAPGVRRERAAALEALREQYAWRPGDGLPAWVRALPREARADRDATALAWGPFGRPAGGLDVARASGAIPWSSVDEFDRAVCAAREGAGPFQRDAAFGKRRETRAAIAPAALVSPDACAALVSKGALRGSSAIERAAAAGNLYACEYARLHDPTEPHGLSPTVLLHGRHDALRPLAIRLSRDEAAPWFTPDDGRWPWLVAKACVEAADALQRHVVLELYGRGLRLAPFALATQRHLHRTHPLHGLLAPAWAGLLPRCDAARAVLVDGSATLLGRHDPVRPWAALARRAHVASSWAHGSSAAHCEGAPAQQPRLVESERRRREAAAAYARGVIARFYRGPAEVRLDQELQSFAADVAAPEGGSVAGFPSRIETPAELADVAAELLYAALPTPGDDTPQWPLDVSHPPPRTKAEADEGWLLRALPRRDALARQLAARAAVDRARCAEAERSPFAWGDVELDALHAEYRRALRDAETDAPRARDERAAHSEVRPANLERP